MILKLITKAGPRFDWHNISWVKEPKSYTPQEGDVTQAEYLKIGQVFYLPIVHQLDCAKIWEWEKSYWARGAEIGIFKVESKQEDKNGYYLNITRLICTKYAEDKYRNKVKKEWRTPDSRYAKLPLDFTVYLKPEAATEVLIAEIRKDITKGLEAYIEEGTSE